MPKAGKRGADDALGAKGGRGSSRGKQQKTAIAAAKAAQTSAPVPASNGSDLVNLIPIRNVKESADEDCLNEVLLSKTEKAPQIVLSEVRTNIGPCPSPILPSYSGKPASSVGTRSKHARLRLIGSHVCWLRSPCRIACPRPVVRATGWYERRTGSRTGLGTSKCW
eukprot:scaffold820_cov376-Prasinococcus_capsulatus_cf.AAC.21